MTFGLIIYFSEGECNSSDPDQIKPFLFLAVTKSVFLLTIFVHLKEKRW